MNSAVTPVIAVATVLAVGFLALVWKVPRIARWVTGIGFLAAGGVNAWTAWTRPELYVQAYGPFAVWGYRQFIYGPFAEQTTLFVLPIALMQLLVGVLTMSGSRLGPLGAMVFLVAITPLGVGAGFPGPPLLAYGMWRLSRRGFPRRGDDGKHGQLGRAATFECGATAGVEPGTRTETAARVGGLALTVACWAWASTAQLSEASRAVLIWGSPLLQFPIARAGRRLLDSDPTPRRARKITVGVHYCMMTALGCALFPAIWHVLNAPTIAVPVLRQAVWLSVLLTGFGTFVAVLTLALRGLGAPFALRLSGRLATDWVYAWTRNPMLLCTLAWFSCLGIWHQSVWFLALLAVSVTPGWIYFVKVYEERELEIRFGSAYAEYRTKVPFLWPRLPPTDGER